MVAGDLFNYHVDFVTREKVKGAEYVIALCSITFAASILPWTLSEIAFKNITVFYKSGCRYI